MSQKIIAAIALLVIVAAGAYFFAMSQTKQTPQPVMVDQPPVNTNEVNQNQPTVPPLPTKTAEEIKIISQIKDYNVEIKNNAFTPAEVKIKVHDQVFWENKDSVPHLVKGADWGGVQIGPGERFAQAFETAGTFPYVCGLHPSMKGTIIVE